MCEGPGVEQSTERRHTQSVAMRAYWRSPEGRARRGRMREAAKVARGEARAAGGMAVMLANLQSGAYDYDPAVRADVERKLAGAR
jgi:hypothetical protein